MCPYRYRVNGRHGHPAWHGRRLLIGPATERWDAVLCIRQDFDGFVTFSTDLSYVEATAHRRAALEDTRLLPIVEGTLADVLAANDEHS